MLGSTFASSLPTNSFRNVTNPSALVVTQALCFDVLLLSEESQHSPLFLTSLSLNLCDPRSPTHATQEHPGVQPHPQQPERALGARLRPGSAVPGGLFLPDRSQTP